MNRKTFCIRFLITVLVIFLSQLTYAQGQMCWPVQTCTITSVSQSGETKVCWDRMECMNYPTGVIQSPANNFFQGGYAVSSNGGLSANTSPQEQQKKACLTKSIDQLKVCRDKAFSGHQYLSVACNAYNWGGAAVGVIAGLAALDDARSGVVVGAGAVALASAGQSCERKIDRDKEIKLANCDIQKMKNDLACG